MNQAEEAPRAGGRRALAAIVLLSLALHAPCLGWGFFLDDHGHQLVFEGNELSPTMTRFNVFDFGYAPAPGEPLFESGGFPWWTSPGWKARFFRPLASCSMALDQALFGRNAVLHHLMGLGIYALVLLAAHRLFRRAGFGARAALFALALFALEDGSALVVGWTANRNSLLEALFAALGLTAAFDARRSGSAGPAALAVGCAVLATLAKESGLASLGMVALLLWRTNRASALLAGLLALGHVAFLILNDYGVRAAMYPAPWLAGGLGPYLENLALTLTGQPLAAISPFPIDFMVFDPVARRVAIAFGAVLAPLLAVRVWRRARRAPASGWFALWALATLLPQSLAPASDRLVFVPTLALAPLVGTFLAAELERPWLRLSTASLVALLALPISGLMLGLRSIGTGALMDQMERVVLDAELEPLAGVQEEGQRDVFVLQYPNAIAGFAGGGAWSFETGDVRTRWFPLQMIGRGLEWTRLDERSFDFTSLDEPFCGVLFEAVFLDSPLAPAVGQRWRAARFDVEARAVDEAGLRTVRVTWHAALTEDGPVFLTWNGERLARIAPPTVGQTMRLERAEPLVSYLP